MSGGQNASCPSCGQEINLARYVLEQLHDHAVVDHAPIHSVGKSTADILRAALRESRAAVDPTPDTPAIELRAQLREAIDRRVHLDCYGTVELADILHSRADLGLEDHVVGRAELKCSEVFINLLGRLDR